MDINGLNLSAICLATSGNINGLNLGGLALVGDNIKWISLGAGVTYAEHSMSGFGLSGIRIRARQFTGVSASAWHTVNEYRGLATGIYNDFKESQTGLSIGIVNITDTLKGVQLGLINIAKNNPVWARILPLVNVHI
jgi:hypothetical protein